MANPYLKRANTEIEYEPWQVEELQKCMDDPIYFIRNYVKIQHATRGTVPFELYDYQEEFILAIHNNKDTLALMSRQLGKTTTAAMYIFWLSAFVDDQACVIASKNMDHATDIMAKIKFAYEELPNWLKPGVKFYNRTSIEWDNGSIIKSQATTEKTGRGNSPSILMLDEISFISTRIQDKIWASIAPALSTGGKLIMTTTPNGDTDLFARLWRECLAGLNSFKHVFAHYTQHPERGPGTGYREEMVAKLGELIVRCELDCEFLSTDALLIQSQRLIELKSSLPAFTDNGFSFWETFRSDVAYLVGVDIATGSGRDFSVVEIFEFPSLIQVGEFRTNNLNIPDLYDRLKWILNKLTAQTFNNKRPEVFWTFERNGVGEAIGALYATDEHPPEFAELINDVPGKFGMQTTNRNKILACLQLKSMVEKVKNGLILNSEINIFELKNFVASGGSYAAKIGATDDSVSALLLIVRLLKYVSEFDDKARKLLYEYNADDYSPLTPANSINGDETSADESDEAIPFLVI